MSSLFTKTFNTDPAIECSAPARANLLGEHTDYNEGYVLPTPLPFRTHVALGRAEGPVGQVTAVSHRFPTPITRSISQPAQKDWLDYVVGCLLQIQQNMGQPLPALNIAVSSDVPMGAGISSSAALEVATLRAADHLFDLALPGQRLALMGQAAEGGYVGMPCGIMDQTVAALGQPGHALMLDTRDLTTISVPLPTSHVLAVVHSGVTHKLVDGGYKERRAQCEAAAAGLGVPSLRHLDVDQLFRLASLPTIVAHRARHVITENRRVLDGVLALQTGDIHHFGRLMVEAHRSQRDDFGITVAETDELVEAALAYGAIGARQTGGGFGGCVIALVEPDHLAKWWQAVSQTAPAAWLVCPALAP